MKGVLLLAGILAAIIPFGVSFAHALETDTFETTAGPLTITFIGHGSVMFSYGAMIVQVDPFSDVGDYGKLPKADLILLTHEHKDHLDPKALEAVKKDKTVMVMSEACAKQLGEGIVMHNGDTRMVLGLKVEAVPAYNVVHMRSEGQPFHPKGVGNGYVITFGDKRVYVAGDTENIPEMKDLKGIDIAFLPMNLPYTMTPEMVADAAGSFRPKVLYPYHYGTTDTARIVALLKDKKEIEVRIRSMK